MKNSVMYEFVVIVQVGIEEIVRKLCIIHKQLPDCRKSGWAISSSFQEALTFFRERIDLKGALIDDTVVKYS